MNTAKCYNRALLFQNAKCSFTCQCYLFLVLSFLVDKMKYFLSISDTHNSGKWNYYDLQVPNGCTNLYLFLVLSFLVDKTKYFLSISDTYNSGTWNNHDLHVPNGCTNLSQYHKGVQDTGILFHNLPPTINSLGHNKKYWTHQYHLISSTLYKNFNHYKVLTQHIYTRSVVLLLIFSSNNKEIFTLYLYLHLIQIQY